MIKLLRNRRTFVRSFYNRQKRWQKKDDFKLAKI